MLKAQLDLSLVEVAHVWVCRKSKYYCAQTVCLQVVFGQESSNTNSHVPAMLNMLIRSICWAEDFV